MKFSMIILVFLFGAVYTYPIEDNVDNTEIVDNKTSALLNEVEEGRWCKMRRKHITDGPKSIPFAGVCDKNKDDCQCYGKRGYCACGPFGCMCATGDMNTEIRKSNCSNKGEWESKNETTEGPKSIPIGGKCDIEKSICQCYGRRSYCECAFLEFCTCTDPSIGHFRFVENEEMKNHCPNKEEWASDVPSLVEPKSIPFAGACDKNKDDCQCYGKRGYCACGPFACMCATGDKNTEIRKSNCPNKKEWESQNETAEEPKSIPIGGKCDFEKNICQCYGKRSYCECAFLEFCTCTDPSIGHFRYVENEEMKNHCPNKEEWASEDVTTQKPFQSIPVGSKCDLNKNNCQCYGKRTYCDCGAESCTCKEATEGDYFLALVERLKQFCENKEEWESE